MKNTKLPKKQWDTFVAKTTAAQAAIDELRPLVKKYGAEAVKRAAELIQLEEAMNRR